MNPPTDRPGRPGAGRPAPREPAASAQPAGRARPSGSRADGTGGRRPSGGGKPVPRPRTAAAGTARAADAADATDTARDTARTAGAPGGAGRITGVDVARGVALLGMVATHVYPPFTGRDADGEPVLSFAHTVAAGRAAAAFAVLAGVALILSTGRLTAPQAWATTFARALGIGAIGLGLGYLDSGIAVILVYYAMLFLLAIPLLRAPAWVLVTVAVGAATAVPVASHFIRNGLEVANLDSPTFTHLATEPGQLLLKLCLAGFYPALAWLAYLCTGMALARADLRSRQVAVRLVVGGLALAATASLLSWLLLGPLGGRSELADPAPVAGVGPTPVEYFIDAGLYGTTPTDSLWWLAVDTPHSSTPFDLAHTTGTALALLGVALLASHLPLLRPLAAVGAMTLTWYTVHVAAMSSSVLPADPARSYLLQILVALALAALWRATGRKGPAEAAIAALSRAARRLTPSRGAVAGPPAG